MDIGAQLRTAREAKGLSISVLAQRTRVPARALAAIELNDQAALPPHPFGRGFVRSYAEEVDLDPEALVRSYFAQFPAPPVAAPLPTPRDTLDELWQPPSRLLAMGTAMGILLVVVAAAVVLGRRGESTADRDMVGTSGSTGTSAATKDAAPAAQPTAPHDTAPSPVASPTPTTASASAAAITVVLSMSRPCWVSATVDGHRTIYQIVAAGERQTLVAERNLAIRFGDAGAVTWTINGRDAGTPGTGGAVRDVTITAENAARFR